MGGFIACCCVRLRVRGWTEGAREGEGSRIFAGIGWLVGRVEGGAGRGRGGGDMYLWVLVLIVEKREGEVKGWGFCVAESRTA